MDIFSTVEVEIFVTYSESD